MDKIRTPICKPNSLSLKGRKSCPKRSKKIPHKHPPSELEVHYPHPLPLDVAHVAWASSWGVGWVGGEAGTLGRTGALAGRGRAWARELTRQACAGDRVWENAEA